MELVKFSITLCVYGKDEPNYLKMALLSIDEQTLSPSQIVIVIDGPVSNKLENIINQFSVKNKTRDITVDIIVLKKNMGHGYARMTGILSCKYEFVILVDADDINVITRFEQQIKSLFDYPAISVLGGQIVEIDCETQTPISKKNVPLEHKDIVNYMKYRCPFNQMSVAFRKSAVLSAGSYQTFYYNEDYYLWIRMYLNGAILKNLSSTLVYARVNSDFYNRRGGYKYFLSECRIQRLMLKENIISYNLFFFNVLVRLVVQLLLPNKIRGLFFFYFFRSKFTGEIKDVK
jgi:glycosyltransferase involved in cell wall biosynthesis